MTLIAISSAREPSSIGTIILSATLRETHTHSAEITDYAIEQGGLVSDHRRIAFPSLTIDALYSNIPVTSDASIDENGNIVRQHTDQTDYTWDEVYAQLAELFEQDAVFRVVTIARVYESMHFASLTVTRDQNTGEVLAFSAELRRMTFASSDVVSVAPAPANKKTSTVKGEKGAKSTTPATDKVKEDANTMAYDLLGSVPGMIKRAGSASP
jgi:hypothetical protein